MRTLGYTKFHLMFNTMQKCNANIVYTLSSHSVFFLSRVHTYLCRITMSGKVSDLPIRYKRAVFTQKKLDRINFRSRSGNGGRVLRNPPGVTRCWSRAWPNDSLSHGIDNMADPVMLSIFGVQLLMFVQVVVIRREVCDGSSATIWYRCKETEAFTQRDKSGRAVIRFT